MKKVMFLSLFVVAILFADNINAQVNVHFEANIGRQPVWGPTGYDHVEYYYFPDIECYYNVQRHKFIYYDYGQWRFVSQLPVSYSSYNLDRAYKVVINDYKPYLNHPYYRDRYKEVIVRHDRQPIIRESDDHRYYQIKEHPHHEEWHRYREEYNRR